MPKVQSTLPDPVPLESCSVVDSAASRSASVATGMFAPPDQTADATDTATVWVSLRSTSVKFSVPLGTGLVVSCTDDPVVLGNSARDADSGPLVIIGASLVP